MLRYLLTFGVVLYSCSCCAEQLAFEFTDPVGDATGQSPDITHVLFAFDNSTGDYEITYTATEDRPFESVLPNFVNTFNNIYNADVAFPLYIVPAHEFGIDLTEESTSLRIVGNDSRLISWNVQDRVALSSFSDLGAPENSVFYSGVDIADFTGRLQFGADRVAFGDWTTIYRVPEPAGILLFAIGLAWFPLRGWRPRGK